MGTIPTSSTTPSAVFDGQIDTYFDASQSDGAWAGIDLGEGRAARVTKISYCPRQSHPQRMTGGRFQAADNPSFTNAVTLYTVSDTPATSVLTSVSVDCPESYRYLRYISPSNGFCNVAEVEFYGRLVQVSAGIDDISLTGDNALTGDNDKVFDLQGRCVPVSQVKKGIYIRNGCKFIVR